MTFAPTLWPLKGRRTRFAGPVGGWCYLLAIRSGQSPRESVTEEPGHENRREACQKGSRNRDITTPDPKPRSARMVATDKSDRSLRVLAERVERDDDMGGLRVRRSLLVIRCLPHASNGTQERNTPGGTSPVGSGALQPSAGPSHSRLASASRGEQAGPDGAGRQPHPRTADSR